MWNSWILGLFIIGRCAAITVCTLGQIQMGPTTCANCAAGTFANVTGASVCLSCDPGRAQPSSTASSCVDCMAGRYSAAPAAATCTLCTSSGNYLPSGVTGATSLAVACVDVDECLTNNGGCSIEPNVTCTNTPGGLLCGSCPDGYTGDGITCTDVNECLTGNGGCDPLTTCTNTIGGRNCSACPSPLIGTGATGCFNMSEASSTGVTSSSGGDSTGVASSSGMGSLGAASSSGGAVISSSGTSSTGATDISSSGAASSSGLSSIGASSSSGGAETNRCCYNTSKMPPDYETMRVLLLFALACSLSLAFARNCTINNGGCGANVQCVLGACGACDPGFVHSGGTVITSPTNVGIMGVASTYGVIASSTITNTGGTTVRGNLALYPGTSVTGFPPGFVTGTQNVANAQALLVVNAAQAAYLSLSGLPCTNSTTPAQLGGLTLTPGVYCFPSSVLLTTGNLHLLGAGLYVFRIGTTLTVGSGRRVILSGGAQSCQIFWTLGSSGTLGTTSRVAGTILATASVTFNTGAVLNGTAAGLNGAVTLDTNIANAQDACSALTTNSTNCTAIVTCEELGCLEPTFCIQTLVGATCTPCPAGTVGNSTVGCVQQDWCTIRSVDCQSDSACLAYLNSTYCICDPGFYDDFDGACIPIDVCSQDGPLGTISVTGGTVFVNNSCSEGFITVFGSILSINVAALDTQTIVNSPGEQFLMACITLPDISVCLPFSDAAPTSTWTVTGTAGCDMSVTAVPGVVRENGGCDPYTECTNIAPGNRTCGPCPKGFTGTGYTDCVQIDLCANVTCPQFAECFSFGNESFCMCDEGYGADADPVTVCTLGDPCAGNWTTGENPTVAVFLVNDCTDGVLTMTPLTDQATPLVGPGEAGMIETEDELTTGVGIFYPFDTDLGPFTCDMWSDVPVSAWTVTTAADGNGTCASITCEAVSAPTEKNGGCAALSECAFAGPGNRTCGSCPPGYVGTGYTTCLDVNECTTPNVTRCSGHGNCTNTVGGFTCSCNAGYYAVAPLHQTCALRTACVPNNPCHHGGTCQVIKHSDNSTSARCLCKPPWSGRTCNRKRGEKSEPSEVIIETNNFGPGPLPAPPPVVPVGPPLPGPPRPAVAIDVCSPNPCFHGGQCRALVVGETSLSNLPYQCVCAEGWSGDRCTHRGIREPCTDHKCTNGGLCLPDTKDALAYTCACQSPWTGAFCDSKDATTVCNDFGHCHNGGHCEPTPDLWHDDSDPEDGIMAFKRGWSAHCVCLSGTCGGSCQRTGLACPKEDEDESIL